MSAQHDADILTARARKYGAEIARSVHGARCSTAVVGFTRSEIASLLAMAFIAGYADSARETLDLLGERIPSGSAA